MSFDNGIVYSVEIGYSKRSTASEFNFNYSGTYVGIRVSQSGTPVKIYVLVDGVLNQTLTMVDDVIYHITLPVGQKYVQLIEGNVNTNALDGCWLKSIILQPSKYSKVNQGTVSYGLTFWGNSITQGSSATILPLEGYAHLPKYMDSKPTKVLGYAGLRLDEVNALQSTWVQYVVDSFANVTTTKKLILMVGINDWIAGNTPTNFNTWHTSLLNAIYAAIPTIHIYCISPLITTGDDADLDSYRTNIQTACTARPLYTTYINGKTILNIATDFADGIHPTTAGHLILYNAIKGIIL